MRCKILRIGISILLLLLTVFSHAFADRIQDYHVDITILEDGKIDVVETIRVSTSHQEIRLGITRDIPLYYYLGKKKIETPVQLLSVTRNGEAENHWVERTNSQFNILTGARENIRENYLPIGSHTYVIHWQSSQHIRSFQKYDELYLNAIGTNWQLPIEKASATIYLPESVAEIQSAGYYGRAGETTRAIVEVISPREIHFTAPSALAKYEGLTVSTGFTPGIVIAIERAWTTKLLESLQNNLSYEFSLVSIAILGLVIILFFYWCIGYIIYRIIQPKSHLPFVVRFNPPVFSLEKVIGLYPTKKRDDKKYILAILVELIRRGIIKIMSKSKSIILTGEGNDIAVSESEKAVISRMKAQGGRINYDSYNPEMEAMKEEGLIPVYEKIKEFYYFPMKGFKLGAFLLLVVYCFVFSEVITGVVIFFLIFLLIGIGLISGALVRLCKVLYDGSFFAILFLVIEVPMLLFFGVMFTMIPISWGSSIFYDASQLELSDIMIINTATLIFSCLSLLIIATLFSKLGRVILPEYVEEQQAVLEFEHFLRYTKKEEYAILQPDIFEEYLAYAIIFGVEKQWLSLFKAKFPEEYQRSQHHGHISSFSIMSSRSFTSSMTAPRSSSSGGGGSSGSGGGGSSGGGSGGGGGGGR